MAFITEKQNLKDPIGIKEESLELKCRYRLPETSTLKEIYFILGEFSLGKSDYLASHTSIHTHRLQHLKTHNTQTGTLDTVGDGQYWSNVTIPDGDRIT